MKFHWRQKSFRQRQPVSCCAFRIVNIGNSNKIKLLDFIEEIEETLNKKAIRNYMPIQKGDVPATWADTTLLTDLTKFNPKTNYKVGIDNFIKMVSKIL